jgi:hypothetical protein
MIKNNILYVVFAVTYFLISCKDFKEKGNNKSVFNLSENYDYNELKSNGFKLLESGIIKPRLTKNLTKQFGDTVVTYYVNDKEQIHTEEIVIPHKNGCGEVVELLSSKGFIKMKDASWGNCSFPPLLHKKSNKLYLLSCTKRILVLTRYVVIKN